MTEIQIFEKQKKKKNEEFFSLLVENHLPITWRIKNLFLLITNNWKEERERDGATRDCSRDRRRLSWLADPIIAGHDENFIG